MSAREGADLSALNLLPHWALAQYLGRQRTRADVSQAEKKPEVY